MKTQILYDNDVTQIVLTPETDLEKSLLEAMPENANKFVVIKDITFEESRSGYYRPFGGCDDRKSFAIVIDERKEHKESK